MSGHLRCHPAGGAAAPGDGPALAVAIATGLAEFPPEPPPGSLLVPLGLSLWMRRHGVDAEQLADSMLGVRDAVIAAGGLDEATEPVPLRVADERTVVLSLAAYLSDLLSRAAARRGWSRPAVAQRAAELLSA